MRTLLLSLLLSLSLAGTCWAGASVDFGDSTDIWTCGTGTTNATDVFAGGGTVAAWINADSGGGGNLGRIISKSAAGNSDGGWNFFLCDDGGPNNCDNSIRFGRGFTGTDGLWTMPASVITFGTWYHVAVVYDSDSTSNDPVMYLNGVAQSPLAEQSPTLTADSDSGDTIWIGNVPALTRNFDGRLVHVQLFANALTATEILQLVRNPVYPSGSSGLAFWPDMMTLGGVDISGGGNTTCTDSGGAVSTAGPPVYITTPLATLRTYWNAFLAWAIPNVYADDIILCDPTDPTVPNRVTSYSRSDDPFKSGAATNPNSLIWSLPASSVNPWDGVVPSGSQSYWKCANTDGDAEFDSVVAMTQAEKDAADAPAVAAAALQASYETEITGNDLCTATLAEITSRIDATVSTLQSQLAAAPNNVAGIKSHLSTQLYPTLGAAFKKLGKCVKARLR